MRLVARSSVTVKRRPFARALMDPELTTPTSRTGEPQRPRWANSEDGVSSGLARRNEPWTTSAAAAIRTATVTAARAISGSRHPPPERVIDASPLDDG